MTVRIATAAEVQALAAIHSQSFATEIWDAVAISGLMVTPGTFALVDCDVTGFILVRAAGGEAEVLTLAVAPAARRRGTASALVVAASERAAEAGAEIMFLEVNASNYPAIALYKQIGFSEVGRRKAYYAGPHGMREDALVFKGAIPLLRVGFSLQLG